MGEHYLDSNLAPDLECLISEKDLPPPIPVTRVTRMWGGAGLINLGQCSRPHMAETSPLVTKTLV